MTITRAHLLRLAAAPFLPGVSRGNSRTTPVSQFYYVEDLAARKSFSANAAAMDILSPAWLTVDAKGHLQSTADPKLVRAAQALGISVMPVLVNDGFRPEIASLVLTDENIQTALLKDIGTIVAKLGFDGIQLDFEEVGAVYRETFSLFAARLAREVAKRKAVLTVAVPAPLIPSAGPDTHPATWAANERAAAFDYQRLAETAESLTLMAYDEYTWGGQPGPVAGLPWVRACVEKVLEGSPPPRVLLGLPLYHRRWSGKKITEGSYADASALRATFSAPVALHAVQQEKVFSFQEGTVPNVVWFNDAESLALRLALVHEYKLGGFSAWRLGQEDPQVWRSVFRSRRRSL